MRTHNRVTLMGRVGQPPEVRQSKGGMDLARFSLATDRRVKEGERWSTVADWHSVVCFDRNAKLVAEHLAKGDAVLVEGDLRYDRWEDADGKARRSPRVVAKHICLLGRPTRPASMSQPEHYGEQHGEQHGDQHHDPYGQGHPGPRADEGLIPDEACVPF